MERNCSLVQCLGLRPDCFLLPVVQVGLSRSTTGCVCACLFREFQLSASYEGLIETVPGVNLGLLRMDNYEIDKSKDTLFRYVREYPKSCQSS